MRITLSHQYIKKLFNTLDLKQVADICHVSVRTISIWKTGSSTIPKESFLKIVSLAGQDIAKIQYKEIPDFWYATKVGRLGAIARNKLYGNFGTSEGRQKGGRESIKTHNKIVSDFKILKKVSTPEHSSEFAEFLGIIAGDGYIGDYQVMMVTHSETDIAHARFVALLGKKLFGVHAAMRKKKNCKAVEVVFSSKAMGNALVAGGLKRYHKIKNNTTVPDWIVDNAEYSKAFIRGLFDTDGCVYLDRHTIKNQTYYHLGWTITSYNGNFISGVKQMLKNLSFHPTNSIRQKSVYLRKQLEIQKYFESIGSHNSKHLERYEKFGRVPKRS